jgi:hypothetical protein
MVINLDVKFGLALLLSKGYAFTVFDSVDEEACVDLKNSTNLDAIMRALGSTDTNFLKVKERDQEGKLRYVADLLFDWGSDGFEALYDYGAARADIMKDIDHAFLVGSAA